MLIPALLLPLAVVAAENDKAFTFSKVDLEFLEQADLLGKRLVRDGLIYHDDVLNGYINQVGRSMLPAGTAPERVKWEFHVARDPMANAFALPNGSIYINTGLLSLLENEDQLASVLAHEITHVTDRHSYLHFRDYRKKSTIASIADFAGRMAPGGSNWGNAIKLAGLLVPALMDASIKGYSRELEKDADIYSFNKLMEGNYDPREMVNTFRLLERKDEVDLFESFYNDHPKLETRIGYITALVNEKAPNQLPEDVSAAHRSKYLNLTESITREDIQLAILARRPRTALVRAAKLVELHPDSGDNLYSMAEAYRALGPWTPRPSDQEFSKSGKKEAEKAMRKFTPDEEEQQLLSKEEGQAAWRENQRLAEDNYQKALAADPANAKAYRGLGQLYDRQRKTQEAVAAFQKYLDLQPNAFDRIRITQRIETLQRPAAQ
jgi:predicted Zn-dependent protease